MKNGKDEFMALEPKLLSLGIDETKIKEIARYVDMLVSANQEINLFSRKMPISDLLQNHIYDSVMAYPNFNEEFFRVLADFGSGGGMPGVLLAILFPDREIRLFEKSPKKCEVLSSMAKHWTNIKVYGAVEPKSLLGVDLVTARAFKPLDEIIGFSKEYFHNQGTYLLYKARLETINEEVFDAKPWLDPKRVELIKLENPFLDVERHLVRFVGSKRA